MVVYYDEERKLYDGLQVRSLRQCDKPYLRFYNILFFLWVYCSIYGLVIADHLNLNNLSLRLFKTTPFMIMQLLKSLYKIT